MVLERGILMWLVVRVLNVDTTLWYEKSPWRDLNFNWVGDDFVNGQRSWGILGFIAALIDGRREGLWCGSSTIFSEWDLALENLSFDEENAQRCLLLLFLRSWTGVTSVDSIVPFPEEKIPSRPLGVGQTIRSAGGHRCTWFRWRLFGFPESKDVFAMNLEVRIELCGLFGECCDMWYD